MRIIASIEARMGSSRLPGKVLADVYGKPSLTRLVSRLRRSKMVHDIVLATSVSSSDDAIEAWGKKEDVKIYRGSEDNVLDRVCKAQKMMNSDIVVEVTGDCTLIDAEVVDMGIRTFLENDCDVVTNTWKLSYPAGVDVQVFRLDALEKVSREIQDKAVQEHVSLYFYEHPELYRILNFFAPERWWGPQLRFQLDYEEDLRFINEVYRHLHPQYGDAFGVEEIMQLLRKFPELVKINQNCVDKPVR